MAQYVLSRFPLPGVRSVLDFVDVDSDKWRQYASKRSWPLSALYERESRTLARFERAAARTFDASMFVSEAEVRLFLRSAPDCAERIGFVENGVDAQFFSPDGEYPDPYSGNRSVLVFTGAMDYWANAEAVSWFATEVFPHVRRKHREARFYIVGARPGRDVTRLAQSDGSVVVTGRVDDVRPFLSHARAAVAPLRTARGVQNKVLEAMAMARPVVATPQALEGLALDAPYPLVAEDPGDWVARILAVHRGEVDPNLGKRLRSWIVSRYAWRDRASRWVELLEGAATGSVTAE
jgi:sugar transferase (PEP-CTERM/EpsH1 system associated)